MHRLAFAVPLLILGACTADADEDGLTNREEKDFGSDPKVADTDADGLPDAQEFSLGTDPTAEDSDGDGYLDFDEVATEHDPADADDRIYKGNWPYYRDKDSIEGAQDLSGTVTEGKRFGHYVTVDQFGDQVDLWDFYNEDKPVVIDVSAQWCPPCNDVAAWMDGEDNWVSQYYNPIRDAVNAGDVYWVTILLQDKFYDPATKKTSKEWYTAYPNDQIPVMADSDYEVAYYVPAAGIPSFVLLKPDLKVDFFDAGNGYLALDELMAQLGE